MKYYRLSPIRNEDQMMKAIEYVHITCYELCKESMGTYLPVAGTIGIFCHYEEEFELLTSIQEKLVDFSSSVNGKYFKLHNPFVFPQYGNIPETTYTHFYIRKPDPYRSQVGDADYYLESNKYIELKKSLLDGKIIKGARIVPNRPDFDYVELFDPDIDALGYVGKNKWY